MGLVSLPAPSENMLVLLVNTAISISLFKGVVRSLLRAVGLGRRGPPARGVPAPDDAHPGGGSSSDRFRCRVEPVRFESVRTGDREGQAVDCRVCLARFEPDSVVNRIPCGHLFHGACLERWLEYHHVTCPLCRTPLLPVQDSFFSWPWR